MESCIRCGITEKDRKIFDAIYNGKIVSICERCSVIENVPLIKKPDNNQLKESNKGSGVYERLRKIAGLSDSRKSEDYFQVSKRLNELERNPDLENPDRNNLDLIEHFHWRIMENRRRKGYSQKQLAEIIGINEKELAMLERGILPENAKSIINKLERFFGVRLIKLSYSDELRIANTKKPVLLDGNGNVLDRIPEPKTEKKEEEDEEEQEEQEEENAFELGEDEDFEIDNIDINKVRVGDLKRIHSKRILDVTKEEKIEEQKKIEDRERLIEARKEELRSKKEKQSQELDEMLGGSELLNSEDDDDDKYD